MAEPPGARVLVTGAGSGAANNLIRDLRAGDPTLAVIGCHDDPFVLRKSAARRNWLVCATGHRGFAASLRRVVQRERIDVVLPTTDLHVWALSRLAPRFPCRLFLPPRRVLALCRDKLALARHLRARGVPAPETHPVRSPRALSAIFRRFGRRPLWCRLRAGSGSAAAIPVRRPEHARSWIAYWSEVRGARPGAFTLAEYLPGRDFFAQGIWQNDRPVLLKTCERLSYFVGGGSPSGVSSVSALSRTIRDRRVADVCLAAVEALGPGVSGTFNLDLKEDAAGVPCVTEINAGRFASGTALLNRAGRHNLAVAHVRLALGARLRLRDPYVVAEDWYSVRDLDTRPGLFRADDLFAGIGDAR